MKTPAIIVGWGAVVGLFVAFAVRFMHFAAVSQTGDAFIGWIASPED